ncbi:MAG TPA: hypothetical protein VK524_02250 [Polyangiaceae bacterium]|nr:hypothetical protein [Polyangiaceae bacterium]
MRQRIGHLWPFVASLLIHVTVVLCALRFGDSASRPEQVTRDAWVGRSVDVETVPERAAALAAPAPAKTPAPAAAAPESAPAPISVKDQRQRASVPGREPVAAPARRPSAPRSEPAAESEAPRASGGDFGSEGLPAGVRRLAVAFTRAVPAATSRDPVWLSLPLGPAGSVRVVIRVNDAGRIVESETLDAARAPEHLERLLQRTLLLLQSGRFAVSGVASGDFEVLRVDVQVSMKEPTEGFEPGQVVRLGFDPPDARGRGRAFFTLGSGRHVEAAIRVERKRG